MVFKEQEIKHVVSKSRNYIKIGQYMNTVDSFHIDHNPIRNSYSLNAAIDYHGYPYEVELQWNNFGKVTYYDCDCYYCTSDSACAHVGAVMRLVNAANPHTFPFHWESNRREMFEAHIKQLRMQSMVNASDVFLNQQKNVLKDIRRVEAKSIKLEPIVEQVYADAIYLRIKIGENRMYFIKNISEFIKDVASNSFHKYGKDFSTSHHESAFDVDSLKILNLMQVCTLTNDEHSRRVNEIEINAKTIDLFFDTLCDMNALDGLAFETVDLFDNPLQLQLSVDGEYIQVELANESYFMVGQKNLYAMVHGDDTKYRCIRMDTHNNPNVGVLYSRLASNPLVFRKEDFSDFDRYILNNVSQYFKVNTSGVIQRVELDNRIDIFGDINEEGVAVFNVKAYHNDTLLNETFTSKKSSSVAFEYVLDIFNEYDGILDSTKKITSFDLEKKKTNGFLQDGLEQLKQFSNVYVSESLKRLSLRKANPIRLGITFSNDLLGIDLEHDIIPKDEIKDVLNAYKRKKKFYRLKNGELVALLDEDLHDAQELLEKTGNSANDLEEGNVHVNPYRVFMLDALASQYGIETSTPFKKHLDALQIVNQTQFNVPDTINASLRPYQVEGYRWLKMLEHYGFGGILADDMGLGKTLQMICYFASNTGDKPHFVICPSSVLLNWEQEILKFSPHLKPCIIHGSKKQRDVLIDSIGDYDVVVTSYDYLKRDIERLKELEFQTVVLDEAQYIKNANSKNSKCVKLLNAKQRFALTGTPIENSLAELWSIFDFLMPEYLYKYKYFKDHFESPIVREQNKEVSVQLKQMVKPFILRRLKTEVLSDLPDKTEIDMLIEFSDEERKLYYANLAQVNEELQILGKVEKTSDIEVLALLTRLRRICCEPRTIYENITHRSSKLEAVVSFIQDLKEDGKQVLLFSSFTSVLDFIAEALNHHHISYHTLDGRVNKVDRQTRVQSFQNGEVDVFLISLRAGGTGINLTNAEVVIHFDPWWNISAQNQATDRAYRFGQTKNVLVYRFIMKDSIEEKIQLLQSRKKQLSDTFVEDSDGSVVTMTKSEILSLFASDQIPI
ncbi:hypothetical protein AOC36_03540 [Erysipelothrix larvae]|uniref:Helicase n=1 Tax=Erysipelothrix larvae TaxID=1514105 RepID=A0A0X8GZ43_9FIRM|nr:DEAD/DEAH box helicase [Erysipelothrix larvae]AMC93082.1 hypothetical protein AOC36_03540 [Erysipelothrix larvae]